MNQKRVVIIDGEKITIMPEGVRGKKSKRMTAKKPTKIKKKDYWKPEAKEARSGLYWMERRLSGQINHDNYRDEK